MVKKLACQQTLYHRVNYFSLRFFSTNIFYGQWMQILWLIYHSDSPLHHFFWILLVFVSLIFWVVILDFLPCEKSSCCHLTFILFIRLVYRKTSKIFLMMLLINELYMCELQRSKCDQVRALESMSQTIDSDLRMLTQHTILTWMQQLNARRTASHTPQC